MARLPDLFRDRGKWGSILLDFLRVSHNEDGSLKSDAVVAAVGDLASDPAYTALDIWDEFDATGSGTGWDASTYAGWISGIDALLAGEISSGDVVKTDLGVCSDNTNHVYSYTAGDGPVTVLLVGGIHGEERIGQQAPMRWFEQFVKSQHATMRLFRHAFRVIWIPTVAPSTYFSDRLNANGVNVNRNFDFFWDRYVPTTGNAKGSAAFSEPEAEIIRDLIINEPVRVFIDCHDMGSAVADQLKYVGPSPWVLGNRALVKATVQLWNDVYNTDGDPTTDMLPNSGEPTSLNWANYYMRWVKGITNAAVITPEVPGTLDGSTATLTSRAAMRYYNGFITTFLHLWLTEGQVLPPAYPITTWAARTSEAASTSIASGGTLIDTGTATPLHFSYILPNGGVGTNVAQVDFVAPYAPAITVITYNGYLESDGTSVRVDFSLRIDGVIDTSTSPVSVQVPAIAGQRVPFFGTYRRSDTALDASTIHTAELICTRQSPGTAKLKRYNLRIDISPHMAEQAVPIVNPRP